MMKEVAISLNTTDYYPFGAVAKQWNSQEQTQQEPYRHGYQGQYAEADSTTGWNAFELGMYDPMIGRWLQVDPMREFGSPYRTGNNPFNSVDPDGGCETCPKFRYVNTRTGVMRNMVNLQIEGHFDVGIQPPAFDIGIFGLDLDVISTDISDINIGFFFDEINNEILWNVEGSSIFKDLANGFIDLQSGVGLDAFLLGGNITGELHIDFSTIQDQLKNNSLKDFVSQFLDVSAEGGAPLMRLDNAGNIKFGVDGSVQNIFGIEGGIWLSLPDRYLDEKLRRQYIAETNNN